MALSVIQQHLFNYLKVVHVTSYSNILNFYRQFFEEETSLNTVLGEILAINKAIKHYDLEIIECVDELTSEKLLILINTVYDEITQKAKFCDQTMSNLFSEIIKECIMSSNGYITETHCLNLSSNVSLTKTASQCGLEIFIRDKWLNLKDGAISLGMRTIIELQQIIKQCYPDYLKFCPLCKSLIMQGFDCSNCHSRFHYACLKKLHSITNKVLCSKCNEEFLNLPMAVQLDSNNFKPPNEKAFNNHPIKRIKIT